MLLIRGDRQIIKTTEVQFTMLRKEIRDLLKFQHKISSTYSLVTKLHQMVVVIQELQQEMKSADSAYASS